MQLFHRTLAIALVAMFFPANAPGGEPIDAGFGTAFSYQGLLQSSGSSATGNYDFEFRLYDAAVGGVAVGPVIANAVAVQDGLFNVSLDFGQAFANEPQWLEISVRHNGIGNLTILEPRQRLHPATQAIYAAKANTADSATTSNAALNGVPAGFSILGTSETPPPGYAFTGTTVSTSGSGWTSGTDMLVQSSNSRGAVIDGKLYVVANGFTEVYDPDTDSWESKTPMPTNRGPFFSIAAVGGKLYVLGGRGLSGSLKTVEMYDPQTDTWTPREDMPTAKYAATAAVVNGKIHSIDYSANEVYDPALDDGPGGNSAWASREAVADLGQMYDSAVVNDKVYIFGGNSSANHVYDPALDDGPAGATAWSLVFPMPFTSYLLSTLVVDGKIYAMGGELPSGQTTNATHIYDPLTNTWATGESLPVPRESHAAGVIDGKIYLSGGIRYVNNLPVNVSVTDVFAPAGPSLYIHVKE